jgi:hypothetical protein
MDPTDELFIILNNCNDWNDTCRNRIQCCIDKGANLTGIHPRRRFTALLYALFLGLHPDSIRLLVSNGYDLDFKVEWTEYIYDDYLGIDHDIKQTASIKNFILAAYYKSIGEHIEDHLLEIFTERDYILNVIHYPLELIDYSIDDYTYEELQNGKIMWHPIEYPRPDVSFVESELDIEYHDMSIYDSIKDIGLVDYVQKKYSIDEYDKQLSCWVKEYCEIFNLDYNTISEWKLDIPDDSRPNTQ